MSYIRKLEGENMLKEYFEIQEEYEKKFGDKTIVLYENGKFYEFYQIHNETEKRGKAGEICSILNIVLTKRDKGISEVTIKNPQMGGIPLVSRDRHLSILIQNDFTVVLIEQISSPPKPERAITRIVSKSTHIDDINSQTNYMMCIITRTEEYKSSRITVAGWCAVDISTGTFYTEEIHPVNTVLNFSVFEEINKVMISIRPQTVIAYSLDGDISVLNAIEDVVKIKFNILEKIPENAHKITYQNHSFQKIFNITGQLSPIETLNLEYKELARISIMTILQYINDHNPRLTEKLSLPVCLNNSTYLQLENNTIEQLDVYTGKKDSLFEIVDFTNTKLGKRLLLFSLLNPIIDAKELQNRYDIISNFGYYKEIIPHLKSIVDIERLYRKIILLFSSPIEISSLMKSLEAFYTILEMMKTKDNGKYFPLQKLTSDITEIVMFLSDQVRTELLSKYSNRKDITGHIFIKNERTLEIESEIIKYRGILKELADYFSLSYFKKADSVTLGRNDSDGTYFFRMTCKSGDTFEKKAKTDGKVKIRDMEFNPDIFKKDTRIKSVAKLSSSETDSISQKISDLEEELVQLNSEMFEEMLREFAERFDEYFKRIIKYIGLIDFFKSGAELAEKYKYTVPALIEGESQILAEEVRHPIVERISDREFITNDIDLQSTRGYLIFGINGIGKSIYMKSVGVNLILAQIGYPVAAKSFRFSPYNKVMTRILSNDNLYKGYSSFMVEMIELKRILDNCDNKTLILADELTHGTEIHSGTAIITAAILELIERGSNFVFTSHLHNIITLPQIKNLGEALKICHMRVSYDEGKDVIIYDRKLVPGAGDPLYGLECCRGLHLDERFLKIAGDIRNEILNLNKPVKASKYNPKLMVDKCYICNSDNDLHTHHITEQFQAGEDGFINIFHKNNMHNLVVLCEECHRKVHKKQIKITGWKFTTRGNRLEYKEVK